MALLGAAACSREEAPEPGAAAERESVGTVTEGMTMEQVLEAWGTPNVKVRDDGGERWSYWFRDDRHRVVGRTYVWFDGDRRVSEVRTTPEPRAPQEPKRPVTITLGPGPGLLLA